MCYGKSANIVENPPESFTDVLKVADIDFFFKYKETVGDGGSFPSRLFRIEKSSFRSCMAKKCFEKYYERRTGKQFKFTSNTYRW